MKYFKHLVLLSLGLISLVILIYYHFIGGSGVVVTSVGQNSACRDVVSVGSVITEIVGRPITNTNDFLGATKNLKGSITLIINNNPRSCTIGENSSLDLIVREIKTGGLRLGIDMGGGLIYSFRQKEGSESILGDIVKTINSRIISFGLINTKVGVGDDSIQILTDSDEEMYIRYLIDRGALEGELTQTIELKGGKGGFSFNDKNYVITLKDSEFISINGSEYGINEYFTLEQVKFHVENITLNSTRLSGMVFDEKDLSLMQESGLGLKPTRLMKQDSGYVFVISVSLSENASKNFAKITKGQEVAINPATGESFLTNPLIISVDNELVVSLPISGLDIGKEKRDFVIWEYESTLELAANDMSRLLSIIESKRLPTEFTLVKSDVLKPKNSLWGIFPYITVIVLSGLAIFFFARYRGNGFLVLPLILIILGEIAIILSIVVAPWLVILFFLFGIGLSLISGEIRSWISWLAILLMFIMAVGVAMSKWVLDISALMGLISITVITAFVGSSIGEKTLRKVHVSFDYKRYSEVLWKLTTIVLVVSSILFFITEELRGFALTIFICMLVYTTMANSVYYDLIRRHTEK